MALVRYAVHCICVGMLALSLSEFAIVERAAANDSARTSVAPAQVKPEILASIDNVLAPITLDGLLQTRQSLLRYVWKDQNPRQLQPTKVVDGSRTGNFALIDPVAAVKTIYVSSTAKLSGFTELAQRDTSECLAVWAQGHQEGVSPHAAITPGATSYLTRQWDRGCDVLIVPMPLRGDHQAIEIETAKEGVVQVGATHDGLALLETADFSAFRLFFDPLYASLNWLEKKRRPYKTISMAGVSGGGWMSVVYPALDDRITDAVSVAGSFPFFLKYMPTRGRLRDLGDWEQTYAPFYRIASYYELYLLGALGPGRSQTLVYNMIDPCCFAGDRAMIFLPKIETKARQLGLNVSGILDDTHERHDISETTIMTVLKKQNKD